MNAVDLPKVSAAADSATTVPVAHIPADAGDSNVAFCRVNPDRDPDAIPATTATGTQTSVPFARSKPPLCRLDTRTCHRLSRIVSLRWMTTVVLLAIFCSGQAKATASIPDLSKIPTPPAFVHEPNPSVLYFVVDTTLLDESSSSINLKERRLLCRATGYPEVNYRWTKDSRPFNLDALADRITKIPGEGTFIISKLKKEDEGVYQCIAWNGNGTAYDREIVLRRTFMSYFPKSDPEIIDVELGDPFQKNCSPPPSVPKARVFWIYKGDDGSKFQTINSTSVAINDHGTIFIQYVNVTDQVKSNMYFTCTAENTELKDYKFGNQFRFNILKNKRKSISHVPDQVQYVSPSVTVALKGESFELFCIYAGYPDLLPEWRKVNGAIDTERVNWGTNFKKSLRVEDVVFSDEGEYECIFGVMPELNRRMSVQVDAAPYWTQSAPQSQNSSEGETVEFVCGAVGRPTPNITFYKNGQRLNTDGHYVIDGARLTITNLRKGDDGTGDNAVYQCKAENQYGFIWANFYLNILSFAPIILEGPGNEEAVVGRPKDLRCSVFGSPKPKIEWQNPSGSGALYRFSPLDASGQTVMTVYQVDKKDEGAYECMAFNKYGNASESGYLTVRDPTRLHTYPSNLTVTAGRQIVLPCDAYSDPALHVKFVWLIDGIPISSKHPRISVDAENHSLIIDNPVAADTAVYTCVAESPLDKAERTATISVKDVPPSPFFVGVTCSERNAAIRFQHRDSPRAAAPVQSFWVQYNSDLWEPDAWEVYRTPVTTRADKDWWTINVPMHPYGNFSFRAIARNEVGDSPPALASVKCSSPPALPESNPKNVTVRGTTPDNLVIYWEPLPRTEWNGPDFHYVADYRLAVKEAENAEGIEQPEPDWESVTVDDPYANHVVIQDQPSYEKYDVRVHSVNALGRAAVLPATVSGYSGEGYPEITPTNFKLVSIDGPSIATFSWDRVDATALKGEFKGYKIIHWYENKQKRSIENKQEALFDPSSVRGSIYNLKPFKTNYAKVLVYNGAYDGPATEPITFEMPEGVPSAVQDLSAFPLSHREIGVIWKPPKEINGFLLGYNLSCCPVTDSEDGAQQVDGAGCQYISLSPSTVYDRIHQLKAETSYRIHVQGYTAPGAGDLNSIDVKTLPENVNRVAPAEPSIAEPAIGTDHINVTWVPGTYDPDNPTPVGDRFYFKYRPRGAKDWQLVHPDGGNFTVTIQNLAPGTVYEVSSVSVVDAEHGGLETESPVHVFTTEGDAPGVSTAGWLIAILIAIIILIIVLIIVCLVIRNRGAKYPVSEKEKEQGREPMLKDDKGFDEYTHPDVDEDKQSLTGRSKGESETDSMAEYGDGETGRFTEDGSFIGQYGAPNRVLTKPGADRNRTDLSTFV